MVWGELGLFNLILFIIHVGEWRKGKWRRGGGRKGDSGGSVDEFCGAFHGHCAVLYFSVVECDVAAFKWDLCRTFVTVL